MTDERLGKRDIDMEHGRKARMICYYLPQFHPTAENDAWWGKGFTEWTNVAKARPMFRGHYQPRVPADLGFYDLRVPEARAAQAELAEAYGIEGFCYWHYWFAGRRLLERPFNEVLKSGEPRLPFCLAWANDTWSGIWHGSPGKILVKQTYPGPQDEKAHFYSLLPAFNDERYIRVDGRPVFVVYRPLELPDARRFVEHWQELAVKSGLKGLYFIGEDWTLTWKPADAGFDAVIPHSPGLALHRLQLKQSGSLSRLKARWRRWADKPKVTKYRDFIEYARHEHYSDVMFFPCIVPNWDNTPRSGVRGYVLTGATPELFKVHLKHAIEQVAGREFDQRVIFTKSWNEWAEGNYLEPDLKFGRRYLEVCRDELMV